MEYYLSMGSNFLLKIGQYYAPRNCDSQVYLTNIFLNPRQLTTLPDEQQEEVIVFRKTIRLVLLILVAIVAIYVIANVCYNNFIVN